MRKTFILILLIIIAFGTGCGSEVSVDDSQVIATVNREIVTQNMLEERKNILLFQKRLQEKLLQNARNSGESEEYIKRIEGSLIGEVTDNPAFNKIIRDMVQQQEAINRGIKVSNKEIEEFIIQSRVAEQSLPEGSEEYENMKTMKKEDMELKGLKTEQEYEDYQRKTLKKSFLKGKLKNKVSEEIAKEYSAVNGEEYREIIRDRYNNFVEELVSNAKIETKVEGLSVELNMIEIPDITANVDMKEATQVRMIARASGETKEIIQLIKQRLDIVGWEANLERANEKDIIITIPACDDPLAAKWLITKGEFHIEDSVGDITITKLDIISARMDKDNYNNTERFLLEFTKSGTKRLADATKANVGMPMKVYLDDVCIASPRVSEPILDGKVQISGQVSNKVLMAILNTKNSSEKLELVEFSSSSR